MKKFSSFYSSVLAGISALLLAVGGLMLTNALAPQNGISSIVCFFAGAAAAAAAFFCGSRRLIKSAPFLMGILLILLLLCPVAGWRVNGALRWLRLADFSFAPALLTMPILTLFWTYVREKYRETAVWKAEIILTASTVLLVVLLAVQPFFSAAGIVLLQALLLFIAGGVSRKKIFAALALFAVTAAVLMPFALKSKPLAEQKDFYTCLFAPSPKKNFHSWSLLTTLKHSRFCGNHQVPTELHHHIPNAVSDAPLVAGCGEFGYIFMIISLLAAAGLIAGGAAITARAESPETRLLAGGMTLSLALPMIFNSAMSFGLMPVGSVAFPFLAYGKTALFANFFAVGVLLAAAAENKKLPAFKEVFSGRAALRNILIIAGAAAATVLLVYFHVRENCRKITFFKQIEEAEKHYARFSTDKRTLLKFPNEFGEKSFTVPEGVQVIGWRAFDNCRTLEKVILPESLVEISSWGFYYNKLLKEIIIPDGVRKIGPMAFANCDKMEYAKLPDGLEKISPLTFWQCSNLQKVVIPESVTEIGNCAFEFCQALELTDIPEQIISIGSLAFRGCENLKNANINENVIHIGENAFPRTAKINIAPNNKIFAVDGNGVIFNKKENILLFAPVGLSGDYIVPEGTVKIASAAFEECRNLKSVKIPGSVKSIGTAAFGDCRSLKEVELPALLAEMGAELFRNCTELTAIDFPRGITEIPAGTFEDCHNLSAINIPETVDSIRVSAFFNCFKLQEIVLPSKLKQMETAFIGCRSLKTFTVPEGVKTIGVNMFADCSALTSVTIPDSVSTIESWAFSGCSSLKSIRLPAKLKKLDDGVFENCVRLISVTLPDSLPEIESRLFANCVSLKSIDIPSDTRIICEEAFANCRALNIRKLPENLERIMEKAFSGCLSLRSLTIPAKVDFIDDEVFVGCRNLRRAVFSGKKLPATGAKVFPAGCIISWKR